MVSASNLVRKLLDDIDDDADSPEQIKHYLDRLPRTPSEGELVNVTCPNCGKTRVRAWPKAPLTLNPVCCGHRPRQRAD